MRALFLTILMCLAVISYNSEQVFAQSNPETMQADNNLPAASGITIANPDIKAPPTVSGKAAPPAMENNAPGSLWPYGSLMLDKKSSEWIKVAVESHTKQIPLEVLLPNLFPSQTREIVQDIPLDIKTTDVQDNTPKVEVKIEAPVFYLKSILYLSPNDWAVWLNNKKITNKSNNDNNTNDTNDINVVMVSKYEVIFLWKKANINNIYPAWKDNFTSIDGEKYTASGKNIVVDIKSGNISFLLKPNQSLITSNLSIVEGNMPVATPKNDVLNTMKQGMVEPVAEQAKPEPTDIAKRNLDNHLENLKKLEILKSVLNHNLEILGK